MNKKLQNRTFWVFPWEYRVSFAIALTLLISGFLINIFFSKLVTVPKWPLNIVLGGVLVFVILILQIFYSKKDFVKWLSGSYAAISVISLYLFLIVIMGFIPQNIENQSGFLFISGFSQITSSYMFLFAQIYLFLVLGMVTIRKTSPFTLKNFFFFVNHFGLWLTLFAVVMGKGDIQRFNIEINKTNPVFEGISSSGETSGDLGFAIQLEEFSIDFYPPRAYIIQSKTGEILSKTQFFSVEKDAKGKLEEWDLEVKDFIEYGIGIGEKFIPGSVIGASPAAFVIAKSKNNGLIVEGWISCGSFRFPGNFLELSSEKSLIMTSPEAKSYSSGIIIYAKNGEVFSANISVGNPVSFNGWKIYQVGYNEKMGRWSVTSVLELVRDPWLWLVYTGFFMLIAGSIFLIFTGESFSKKSKN